MALRIRLSPRRVAKSNQGHSFLDDDFLLENGVASDLYHRFAEPLPIIDYHSHLPPEQSVGR